MDYLKWFNVAENIAKRETKNFIKYENRSNEESLKYLIQRISYHLKCMKDLQKIKDKEDNEKELEATILYAETM